MKYLKFLSVVSLMGFCHARAQETLEPGVERWAVKTSVVAGSPAKTASISKLLSLPNPITSVKDAPEDKRIPKTVNGLKEGDMVTTTCWLHLVALEDDSKTHRDGDYHIQVRNSPVWGDTCLIVEIPDSDFISDPALRKKCAQARLFVLSKLLKNKEAGTAGNKMQHEVFVKITGQLFFDATHLKGRPRGKRQMHSYTCWELHPVTAISFAPKPG